MTLRNWTLKIEEAGLKENVKYTFTDKIFQTCEK